MGDKSKRRAELLLLFEEFLSLLNKGFSEKEIWEQFNYLHSIKLSQLREIVDEWKSSK